jgi:transglutaminase-like putative cysteine protease
LDVHFFQMKTPPFLLGAALIFWGWQAGFFVAGALMAVILEGARFVKVRWDFSDEDFTRMWTFCTLLFLGLAIYAFTDNGGPESFRTFFADPARVSAQRQAGSSSAQTAASLIRWLPMIFFLFAIAQAYSSREEIPLKAISLIVQHRWKKAKKSGQALPAGHGVNVAYPYFVVCLFAASVHRSEGLNYFYGVCILIAWALWPQRSRRFNFATWTATFVAAIALGYAGQLSVTQLQRYLEGLNPQWVTRFLRRGGDTDPAQSKTAIGQIGAIKTSDKIVIRVESKDGPPLTYLREASYWQYNSPYWRASQSPKDFGPVPVEKDQLTWILVREKPNIASVSIACYLSHGIGLLPLPSTSGRLEKLPAYVLQRNSTGAVLAEGPGMLMFDVLYGPGPMMDSPPTTNDIAVPFKEMAALDQIVSNLNLTSTNLSDELREVGEFFQNKFTYRTWQDSDVRVGPAETPLSRFLLRTRAGHCEYFATATVLLLRQMGIPARYAVGYAVHERSGREYVVRERDAHAWCMVWNSKIRRWDDFDTTPAIWVEEENRHHPLQWLRDGWSWIKFQIAKLRWGQGHLRQYLLLSLAPVLAVLFYQIVRKRKRMRSGTGNKARQIIWPGLDSEFYQIESQLAERGVERQPNEPLSEWLERASMDSRLIELREPLYNLLRLHYRYRFDPLGLSGTDREELRKEAHECLGKLSRASSRKPARKINR